ncbi:MAG: hypothetical protein H5T96_00065 [Tissierellales bacterium]|nr:hypothetical protein [Tissierellales bacterium]
MKHRKLQWKAVCADILQKTFEKVFEAYNPKTITKQNKDTNKDFYGNQISEFEYGQLNRINIIIRAFELILCQSPLQAVLP